MATRSTIAIQNPDGTVTGVYCHWNGYIEYNGLMLLVNYKTESKIRNLIRYGDMSVLRSQWRIPAGKKHSFDQALPKVTIYYERDRGEDDCEPVHGDNWSDFIAKYGHEFNYLFSNGQWWVDHENERFMLADFIKNNYTDKELKQHIKNNKKY